MPLAPASTGASGSAATYSFVLCDVTTGAVVDELVAPMGVSYTYLLNRPGSFNCSVPKNTLLPDGNQRVTYRNLYPASLALYVRRNGVIVWGGLLWSLTGNSSQPVVNLSAIGWWEYLRHLRVGTVTQLGKTASENIAAIFNSIATFSSYRNVLFTYEIRGTSSDIADVQVLSTDYRMMSDALETAMNSVAYFDFQVEFVDNGTSIYPNYVFIIPYINNNAGDTLEYVVGDQNESTGNLSEYSVTFDGSKMANVITGIGQQSSTDSLNVKYVADYVADLYGLNVGYTDTGYSALPYTTTLRNGTTAERMPIMETVYRRSEITNTFNLSSRTIRYGKQVVEPPAQIRCTGIPNLVKPTFMQPGESTRVRISDGFFQFDGILRCSQVSTKLGDDYSETVSIDLAPQDVQ
ncbi:hypothetical protein UFOVP238_41 [uncultured Caudovirales phage]|uniref:Uncharacterized protein n=1 Tax=uncultured Caudovirales phage TaxID=2100421 RepID=A0A6J7WRN7_9CAUD|nr:hypothetical protein UFOVP238_41 [uncultured Caudovirales phage]